MASYPSCLSRAVCSIGILCILLTSPVFDSNRLTADDNFAPVAIEQVDEVMFVDPEFARIPPIIAISNEPIALWLKALARPDADLQRMTLDTICIAHQRGMDGIDVTISPIVELLGQPELESEVRRSAVKTLIQISGKDQAEMLAKLSLQHGLAIAFLVDPALAQWKSTALADHWMERMKDTGIGRQSLIDAINGLGAIEKIEASERLLEIVDDRLLPVGIRMAAARSAGAINQPQVVELAADLINQPQSDVVSDLLAVALLSRQTNKTSIGLLSGLMKRESTVVQAESLQRLYKIDPALVLEFVDQAIASNDVNVRRVISLALISSREQSRIAPLATLLDDVNPDLRRHVAAALVDLASDPGLHDEVISQTSGILDQDQWRGCEQAALVLVNLDHQAVSDRLVDLISHPRGEVMVTAGWGLRRFALKKHLPAMLGRAQSIYDGFKAGKLTEDTPGMVDLMSQLFMAFGQMRYQEADGLARKYVVRDFSLGLNSRAAAAWSIGLLHEGKSDDDLERILLSRLHDVKSMEPELGAVRRMCAVSLARIKAEKTLPDLRTYATDIPGTVCRACFWAIEKLTGEKPPELPPPNTLDYSDWFLTPVSAEAKK